MFSLHKIVVAFSFASLLVLAACGGGVTPTVAPQPAPATTTPTPAQAPRVVIASAAPSASANPDCGAGWLATLNELAQTQNADAIQLVSWNDYEKPTQVESGVDNCVKIAGSVSGYSLSWTATGTTASVDHYAVYTSTDGVNLTPAGIVPPSTSNFDLSTLQLTPATPYSIFVYAVGRPSFQNKISPAISYTSPAGTPPSVTLTVSPQSGTAQLSVSITMTSSASTGHTITGNVIDFGDGTTLNGTSATHTYGVGTYTVKATATDNAGLTTSATKTVTATPVPPNQPPVARLNVVPNSGTAPLAVVASAAASTDPDGTIASVSLDFGDGTVVSAASASHTYNTPGTFTVTATVKDNGGLTSTATMNVVASAAVPPPPSGSTYTAYGITFPQAHPRLWWNASRINQAKTWLSAHPFTPGSSDYFNIAWKHVVSGTDCTVAVNWAANYAPPAAQVTTTANGSDELRWNGENAIIVYDWCNDQFTPSQKTAFISNWNIWLGNADQQPYPNPNKPHSNYNLGYMRNEIEYGIAAYGDSTMADPLLSAGLNKRWGAWTTYAANWSGGVPNEGSNYSAEMFDIIIPFETTALNGRDALDEVSYYREMVYWMIYATTPSQTFSTASGKTLFQLFPFSDDERFVQGGILSTSSTYSNFGQWASDFWATRNNLGRYARRWFDTTQADSDIARPGTLVTSLNTGTTPMSDYSALPVDLYSTATHVAYMRKTWDTSSAAVNLQMGGYPASADHAHFDFGNFQMWRGGRWLCRETTGYANTIAGTAGINSGATQSSNSQFAHNSLTFTNVALGLDASASYSVPTAYLGQPVVNRLESQPGYFYADVDLTNRYKWDNAHSQFNTGVVGHVEREFVWVRNLETLVVFDRITTLNQTHGGSVPAAQVVTSFVTHSETNPTVEDSNHYTFTNGTQVLRQTVLIPANATYRVINEQSCSGCSAGVGQYRVEVDNSGTAQRYHLHVLQARDTSTSNITATVVDSNPSDPTTGTFTVRLHPSVGPDMLIVLNKGVSSSGGTVDGTALAATAQRISYTDNGPVWQ